MASREDDNIRWYHGKLSREDAETHLKSEGSEDGFFLVRDSSSAPGDFVLTVLYEGEPVHYQIRRHGEDAFFSINVQTIFHGLETLIEYYQEDAHGLVTRLTKECRKNPPPHNSRRHGPTNLLHRATREGNYMVVSELLKCGYRSLEAKNDDGQTAVHLASRLGMNEILRRLINKGANVNCRDTAGYSPLHYAARANLPHTVRLLVQEGNANVQVRHTDTGWVPLHEAASLGHCEVVQELLALNAPAHPRSLEEETPAELAAKNKHHECEKLLRDYKVPPAKSQRQDWYHRVMERHEAVTLLTRQGLRDGQFLVRRSGRNASGYVLSMAHMGFVYHFQICQQDNYYFIDNGPYLDSLEHVIAHYSCMSDGLPHELQEPIPPPAAPEVPVFPSSLNGTLRSNKNRLKVERGSKRSTSPRQCSSSGSSSPTPSPNPSPSQPRAITPTPTPAPMPGSSPNPSMALCRSHSLGTDSNYNALQESRNNPTQQISLHGIELIPRECLALGDVLGKGEFGSVLRATYTDLQTGETQEVAVKTLRDEHGALEEAFLSEARLMMRLAHPCVVRLLGVSRGDPLLMVQELVLLGSMHDFLLTKPHLASPQHELRLWAAQIACGMQYLESERFVHRDLAARNILLSARNQAKISDFGLSRAVGNNEYYRATQGGRWPIKWYAPESYNFGTFSHASDVWSFGVTLWEMYSYGQQPYGDIRGAEVIEMVEKGERLEQPSACPDAVYRQMETCWSYLPADRPSFKELLTHFTSQHTYENVIIFDQEGIASVQV